MDNGPFATPMRAEETGLRAEGDGGGGGAYVNGPQAVLRVGDAVVVLTTAGARRSAALPHLLATVATRLAGTR